MHSMKLFRFLSLRFKKFQVKIKQPSVDICVRQEGHCVCVCVHVVILHYAMLWNESDEHTYLLVCRSSY